MVKMSASFFIIDKKVDASLMMSFNVFGKIFAFVYFNNLYPEMLFFLTMNYKLKSECI